MHSAQWGWTGAAITGDPRVYGRVYVATNGRGIIYGDTAGSAETGTGACPVTYGITSPVGFTGSWSGSNGRPTAFKPGDQTCTVS